jgi:replicative DNA helicase Mcm
LSKDDFEKKLFLKYVLTNYREQLQMAKAENKPAKISIDYTLLNDYFKKETGKEFLTPGYELFIKYVENRINKDATQKNYISLKLVEVPPNVMLHDLDTTYNGELVSCKAMIKTITEPIPALKQAAFICQGCGVMHYVDSDSNQINMPSLCPSCGGRNFKMVDGSSTFHNIRYVKLEEPLEFRQGGTSREFKGYMQDYLASPQHNIKAGDVCDVLGTFNVERISPNKNDFEFIFKLHNIAPVDDAFEDYRITEADKEKIRELSQTEGIYQRLVDTLMPEIYGYKTVKEGLLLQLFEGNRPLDDSFKTDSMDRWTIHVLLIGDPGIGKSQIINALDKRAPKIMSIAGTSTSQAGLTTSAVKDELTGTWTLEAGAVVLADTGLLCVDEYDKLSATAQKSLNEPMEQLSVSSAKAGLVQKMSARTSVLACANPKYSRFNKFKLIKEQIDIPESNLSRFDLVFALEDTIDKEKDRILATNLLNKEGFIKDVDVIDLELFKKYITYAKMECFPVLDSSAQKLLVDFYVNTRQAALETSDGKPVTARDLKALERLTIARAKTELREVATSDDARDAIRIYSEGLASVGLTPETAGELEHVWSNNEIKLVEEAENMIKILIDRDEMFYEDILEDVRHEIGLRCHELKCDLDDIMNEARKNVEKGF